MNRKKIKKGFLLAASALAIALAPNLQSAELAPNEEVAKLKKDSLAKPALAPAKWKVIGCQLHTVWLPPAIFENFIYEIPDEQHYKLHWAELTFGPYAGGFPKSKEGTLLIDSARQPAHIDLKPSSGPFAGQVLKGIFELDHDLLKVNFAFPGNERPSEFNARQGEVYEIWQRL